jgi:DNA mismatch endonuclease (patch repair protein)
MARVRSKNTRPELLVRKLTFALGYRYRLHDKKLPGSPDLVFRPRRKVIFVHGCFWHQHERCSIARVPKSRQDFWTRKFEGNKLRDQRNKTALARQGWKVLTIWECQLVDPERVSKRIGRFLDA